MAAARESRERLGGSPLISITYKFGNRARDLKRRSRFVILSVVFEAKDLTRPDKASPTKRVKGGCQRAFAFLRKGVVCFERALG